MAVQKLLDTLTGHQTVIAIAAVGKNHRKYPDLDRPAVAPELAQITEVHLTLFTRIAVKRYVNLPLPQTFHASRNARVGNCQTVPLHQLPVDQNNTQARLVVIRNLFLILVQNLESDLLGRSLGAIAQRTRYTGNGLAAHTQIASNLALGLTLCQECFNSVIHGHFVHSVGSFVARQINKIHDPGGGILLRISGGVYMIINTVDPFAMLV